MERSAPECSQSDHASASNYIEKEISHSTSVTTLGTPTSEHSVYPPSSRTTTSPQQFQRAYQPASSGGMAHQPNSPSMPQNGRKHQAHPVNSDNDVPIDPSIAAQTPSYPYGQHPAYAQPPHMGQYPHPSSGMYAPRADWPYPGQHGHMGHGHPVYAQSPASAPPQRPNQVYSFVPIPGAVQNKRPRRRYEEIERMYKCGYEGCCKAYGTLNHLNAHVTMQSHGCKRTPEEFKEIRKVWKARKKEEEAQRKAEEERQRAHAAAVAAQNEGAETQPCAPDVTNSSTFNGGNRPVQLPPIGIQSNQYPAPPSANVGGQQMAEYPGGHIYSNYPPHSSYGQATQAVYHQSNGTQASNH